VANLPAGDGSRQDWRSIVLVSFSIAPHGVGEGLGEFVAGMMPLIEASGLPFKLGAMQTTIEGDEPDVMQLIMSCHRYMRERAPRVVTHITIDDRAEATGRLEGKVQDVERILGRELVHE
jgi:uncharacterized protein (TIGR00106 family)